MFGDFSDKDFALVVVSVDNYDRSCMDLVSRLRDMDIDYKLISDLVNVQRCEYGLDKVNHKDYKAILLDKVVSGSDYFFKCQNLKVILCTLVTVYSNDNGLNADHIIKIVKNVRKFVSFKINFNFDISKYCDELLNYK